MNPIFTAKFYKEIVELDFGKNKEKTISVQDFANVFNNHIGHLLPTKVDEEYVGEVFQTSSSFVGLKTSEGGKSKTVYLYKPEHRANLLFNSGRTAVVSLMEDAMGHKASTKVGEETLAKVGISRNEGNLVVSNYLVPNFFCAIPLKLSDDKKKFSIGKVKYAITNTPREGVKLSANTIANMVNVCGSRPPLPNFYDDGAMCYGSNQVLVTLANDGNYRPLEYYQNLITASAFSFDIMPYRYPSMFSGANFFKRLHGVEATEGLPDPVKRALRNNERLYTFFDYVTLMAQPNAKFPYEEFKNEGG